MACLGFAQRWEFGGCSWSYKKAPGGASCAGLAVMRLDQGNQTLPWHNPIHLDQEQFLAGLLALTGVLVVGESDLFHRKLGRWPDAHGMGGRMAVESAPVMREMAAARCSRRLKIQKE